MAFLRKQLGASRDRHPAKWAFDAEECDSVESCEPSRMALAAAEEALLACDQDQTATEVLSNPWALRVFAQFVQFYWSEMAEIVWGRSTTPKSPSTAANNASEMSSSIWTTRSRRNPRMSISSGHPTLTCDERFADYLREEFPLGGAEAANEIARRSRDAMGGYLESHEISPSGLRADGVGCSEPEKPLWWLWLIPGSWGTKFETDGGAKGVPEALMHLGVAIWKNEFQDQYLKWRADDIRYLPALPASVFAALEACLFAPSRRVMAIENSRSVSILNRMERPVGRLRECRNLPSGELDLRHAQKEVAATQQVAFVRTLNFLLVSVYRNKALDPDDPDVRVVTIEGGLEGFAKLARVSRAYDARVALDLGTRVVVECGTEPLYGLWTYLYRRGNQHGTGTLRVEVSKLLTHAGGHRENLIPVLSPSVYPKPPSERALAAPTLLLAMFLLESFRRHAAKWRAEGHVHLDQVELDALFARIDPQLSRTQRNALFRATVLPADSDESGLFRQAADDRVMLDDSHADIIDFLTEGGRRSAQARAKGRKGARTRWRGKA